MSAQQHGQPPPGWLTIVRDLATFLLGILIVLKQAGIGFSPPDKISIELLVIGALCCNVPGILQVLAWRSGQTSIDGSGSPQDRRPVESPQVPLSTSLEGKNGAAP